MTVGSNAVGRASRRRGGALAQRGGAQRGTSALSRVDNSREAPTTPKPKPAPRAASHRLLETPPARPTRRRRRGRSSGATAGAGGRERPSRAAAAAPATRRRLAGDLVARLAPRTGSGDLGTCGRSTARRAVLLSKEPPMPRRGSFAARGGADRRSHPGGRRARAPTPRAAVRPASPPKRAPASCRRRRSLVDAAAHRRAVAIAELMMKAQARKSPVGEPPERPDARGRARLCGRMTLQREVCLADGNRGGGAAAAEQPIALANTAVLPRAGAR